jgi:hypothetical protein
VVIEEAVVVVAITMMRRNLRFVREVDTMVEAAVVVDTITMEVVEAVDTMEVVEVVADTALLGTGMVVDVEDTITIEGVVVLHRPDLCRLFLEEDHQIDDARSRPMSSSLIRCTKNGNGWPNGVANARRENRGLMSLPKTWVCLECL